MAEPIPAYATAARAAWADAVRSDPELATLSAWRAVDAVAQAVVDDVARRIREFAAHSAETSAWLHGNLQHDDSDEYDRGRASALEDAAVLAALGCCPSHRARGCCDTDDCGPCCPNCPTCPTLRRQRADEPAPRSAAAGGGR